MRISDWSSTCALPITGTPVEFARLRIGNAGLGGADLRLHGNGGRLAALARGAAQDLEAEHAGAKGAGDQADGEGIGDGLDGIPSPAKAIGRATCRDRGCHDGLFSGVAETLKK